MSYLALLAGLALLFGGGEAMLRGAVGVARRFGLSEVFVGIAIVGCATSAPELFVTVDAALAGQPDIAFGNVVGSNTANLLLILGVGAAIRSFVCHPGALRADAAMLTLAALTVGAIYFTAGVSRPMGALMALALVAYLLLAFQRERAIGRATRAAATSAPEPVETSADGTNGPTPPPPAVAALIGLVLAGLAALALGAEFLVYGAVQIAEAAGVSERVISLSLVALGTSLPELATSIVAATRGQSDVAIGNVFGSCVFNVFGILGVTALVAPIAINPTEFAGDIAVMALASALVLALALLNRGVSRPAGVLLAILYFAYMAMLYLGPTP